MASQNPHDASAISRVPHINGALDFRFFPDSADDRERLNAISQSPDDNGNVLCWRRRQRCNNPDCRNPQTLAPYKFKASDRDEWNCPICGRDRHCRALVPMPNRGCRHHGGKTPVGWELPQTKRGEYSKHLRLNPLREDYERLLSSEELYSVNDSIALLKARLNEIVGEYGGGASRKLLQRQKRNRAAYKKALRAAQPDAVLVRELDEELDQMIAEGAEAFTVIDDYKDTARNVSALINDRDRHVQLEKMMITSDKAWVMLAHVEKTFRVGAHTIVEGIDEEFVQEQCEILGVDFHSLSPERVQELLRVYQDQQQNKKREMLAYSSKRFGELADSGIVPGPR